MHPYSPNDPNGQNPYAAPNPYAPPTAPSNPMGIYRQNVFVPHGAVAGPLVGPGLRNAKLAIGVLSLLSLLGAVGLVTLGIVGGRGAESYFTAGIVAFVLVYLFVLAHSVVSAIWIYKFWSWIPPEERHTTMWKRYISPGMAVGFIFVPYFNLYWFFVVYLGVAEIMERLRLRYPTTQAPARPLAIASLVASFVVFPAAPVIQYFFAKRVETMAKEMQPAMPVAGA